MLANKKLAPIGFEPRSSGWISKSLTVALLKYVRLYSSTLLLKPNSVNVLFHTPSIPVFFPQSPHSVSCSSATTSVQSPQSTTSSRRYGSAVRPMAAVRQDAAPRVPRGRRGARHPGGARRSRSCPDPRRGGRWRARGRVVGDRGDRQGRRGRRCRCHHRELDGCDYVDFVVYNLVGLCGLCGI